MRTRSSSFAQILEQRKRKAQRQQRELELLLETAGIDRPDITDFKDSTVRTTRRASAGQTPESPPRSSKVQVIIKSNASLLRTHSHLQATSHKLKEPPDKRFEWKGVDPTEEDKSSATATSDTEPSGSAENKSDSSVFESFARPDLNLKWPKSILHWSLPSSLRQRQQFSLIRKTTSQSNLKRTSTSKSRRLHKLEKAVKRLERGRRVAQIKPLNWQEFSAPVPSKAPRLSQDLFQQISPHRSDFSPEKESSPPKDTVAAEKESGGLVLLSQSITPRDTSPTKPSSMSRQPEDDHEMSGVDENSVVESKTYPLTDECQHYERRDEVPWDIQKYWSQRYSIFSMYDEGIYMTDDAWFGVTPEPVANKVAGDLAASTPSSKTVVIDIFAGAGGNAIAFALSNRWSTVIAIERNPSVIACAQHNAKIYDVADRITWINDDCFSYLKSNQSSIDPAKAVIFASPPWGGPGYSSDAVFNLKTMSPYSAKDIHQACKGIASALYLPRTSDLKQIARLAPAGKKVEVVQYCMEGASKALVAYIPAAA